MASPGCNDGTDRSGAQQLAAFFWQTGPDSGEWCSELLTFGTANADDPYLEARSRPVHFSETFVGEGDTQTLSFDYTLREGLATSTNALTLMKLVGLEEKAGP